MAWFVHLGLLSDNLDAGYGLSRFDLPILLVARAVAALVVIPWPVTGVTSLGLAFQSLAWALPHSWRVGFSSAACSRRRGVSTPAGSA